MLQFISALLETLEEVCCATTMTNMVDVCVWRKPIQARACLASRICKPSCLFGKICLNIYISLYFVLILYYFYTNALSR